MGPIAPGTTTPNGARVPGTQFQLDPVKAAWDIGCIIRWLDFNDTWLAAEWGHPSDNLGGILASADYLSRCAVAAGKPPRTMRDVLSAMVKAHEIQGCLALENSFNRVGLDHVLLVRVATAAVVMRLFGGSRAQIVDVLSHAFIDGSALRTYRHAPNAGPRKSWAAGDATSRAVRLALLVLKGEIGYPSALTAPTWGFYDVAFNGQRFSFQRPYGSYVMENVLFKISFPAEFHAQTAVEAAVQLHGQVVARLDDIERIALTTHESAIRIISKTGALNNPADRDHCLQYMTAIGLLKGDLTADDYEDSAAADPRIDRLRDIDGGPRRRPLQPRIPRPGQAQHRQRRAGLLQGRHGHGESCRGIPHRPPPPPRRRHPPAHRQVRAQSGNALSGRPSQENPRTVLGRRSPCGNACA